MLIEISEKIEELGCVKNPWKGLKLSKISQIKLKSIQKWQKV